MGILNVPDLETASADERAPLFPAGCTCSEYGHGLTMTRVTSRDCPVHGDEATSS